MVCGMGTEKTTMKLLRLILAWFPNWAQKISKSSSWGLFWPCFRSGHRKGENEAPVAYSGLVPEVGAERVKIKLLRLILAWFPEWAQKGSQWSSWGFFWPDFLSGHCKNQNEAPKARRVCTERVNMCTASDVMIVIKSLTLSPVKTKCVVWWLK